MCTLERHGRIFVLRLAGETEHRLTQGLCSDILHALDAVDDPSSGAAALVTTNDGRFFSNGLDLAWADYDRAARLPSLLASFEQVALRYLRLGVPTVAAVRGHAAGAGFLLAMAHDYRVMRRDRGFLYFAAVDVGVQIPAGSMALLSAKMGGRAMRDAVLRGRKWTAEEAAAAGMVDRVAQSAAEAEAEAVAEAEELAAKGWLRHVYRNLRVGMYADAVAKMEENVRQEAGGARADGTRE
ncbi:enoyl-CoA delta isomerase 3-like [Nymphaea colorata]|uniref:Delta(3)-Delta(2)-enoyl-CoA isomerase n=1 Tax=Nymphaea colorata TaxID=210225 RepID=A0A5K0XLS7_9MAGN|nr:enoyl-CoA delta isomerase 3-like [Nymphaea colorata]